MVQFLVIYKVNNANVDEVFGWTSTSNEACWSLFWKLLKKKDYYSSLSNNVTVVAVSLSSLRSGVVCEQVLITTWNKWLVLLSVSSHDEDKGNRIKNGKAPLSL